MHIETTRHNHYSYLRQTGEIVPGIVADENYVWTFKPNQSFQVMPEVDMFILGITEQCNLRCRYCCYSGEYKNNRTHSERHMTLGDVDEALEFIRQFASKEPVRIAFYGGEPLLHYDIIQYAIGKAQAIWGDQVSFSITTNATLLTTERIRWLIQHQVKLEISIDGAKQFHDQYRKDKKGNGSYDRMHDALAYIMGNYPDYQSNVKLLMTLVSLDNLVNIAEAWSNDAVLWGLSPSSITGLAPNFARGVNRKSYDELRNQYLLFLDAYDQHRDWLVLKVFFDECLTYWVDRPIVEADGAVPMSTCMPRNTKLFIDAEKHIAVCEKISDTFRIGRINTGVDWNKANEQVQAYYDKRVHRCAHCPAIRMCDLCLTAVEFDDAQLDMLCHNERVYAQLYMFVFCEMAERGMIA